MTQEKAKFGEQAVNKFIEMVLARLVKAESLKVRIKANLKRLLRGELDALTIEMFGFLLQRNLVVAEFRFDIGSSAVNLRSIRHRKIELLYPTEGSVRMVITQEQLTAALNAESAYPSGEQQENIQLQQVNCELRADNAIAFDFNWICDQQIESGTCITTPRIQPDGKAAILDRGNVEGKEPPLKFVNAAIAQVNNILSLVDIANQGTTFHLQQIDIELGKLTLKASAYIEQFPSG